MPEKIGGTEVMNITSWDIYWITRLDNIRALLILLSVLFAMAAVCSFVGSCEWDRCGEVRVAKIWRVMAGSFLFIVVPVLLCAIAFIPTTKEACMMFVVPKLTNSEYVKALQGDAKELYTLGIERLKEELSIKNVKNGDKK